MYVYLYFKCFYLCIWTIVCNKRFIKLIIDLDIPIIWKSFTKHNNAHLRTYYSTFLYILPSHIVRIYIIPYRSLG